MGLILKLKRGEHLAVNGALIRFETSAKIVLKTKSAVMHDRQIMRPEQVTTPASQIYFAVQGAYMASAEEREAFVKLAHLRISEFRGATSVSGAHGLLDAIAASLDAEDYYPALQSCRQLLDFETALFDLTRPSVAESPLPEGVGVETGEAHVR